ncbi:uncharacterized protein LOC136028365 isoform X1 [Artemia franciscana]|uniref:uncharacterized protein LOC136028365 isoform X1 n=1 Tax=Artemia franciscana TaxID=6661 RepID=UPI0032DA497F
MEPLRNLVFVAICATIFAVPIDREDRDDVFMVSSRPSGASGTEVQRVTGVRQSVKNNNLSLNGQDFSTGPQLQQSIDSAMAAALSPLHMFNTPNYGAYPQTYIDQVDLSYPEYPFMGPSMISDPRFENPGMVGGVLPVGFMHIPVYAKQDGTLIFYLSSLGEDGLPKEIELMNPGEK